MKAEVKYRYPGVAPFLSSQHDIFFGRDREIKRLTTLVNNEQQVLLYGKSGLGKSSLINAGLIPELARQKHALIYTVRIGAYQNEQSPTPLQAFHAALPAAPASIVDRILPQEGSLWYHFKSLALTASARPTFYILFDQFEELFTHPRESIFAFKKQMADLLYRVVPRAFREVLEIRQRTEPDVLSGNELWDLNLSMNIHVLYAIREDRYSHLNKLSDYLPDILQTRYQLGPLTRENAEEAIVKPASIESGFATPSFLFSKAALDSILNGLTKGQQQVVETTQLQILCGRLEKLGKREIRRGDIPKFEDIFLEFYYECIGALPEFVREQAQEFIEEHLIIAGQRVALDRLVCLQYLDEPTLDFLLRDRHLLRAEQNSTGGSSLELSHDSLISPIMCAREDRRHRLAEIERAHEAQRLRAELEREQAARKKERRRLKRNRRNKWIAILFAFIFCCMAYYAFRKRSLAESGERKAIQEQQIADNLRLQTESALNRMQEEERKRELSEAKAYFILAKNLVFFQEDSLATEVLDSGLHRFPCDAELLGLRNQFGDHYELNCPQLDFDYMFLDEQF